MSIRLFYTGLSLICLAGSTACDTWPQYAADGSDRSTVAPGEDPRAKVSVVWTQQTEPDTLLSNGADNGTPLNVKTGEIGSEAGYQVDGTLHGVGWNADFEAPSITADGCETGSRSVSASGDWAGDVDFYRVNVTEPGVLCVTANVSHPDIGWDLLVFPLDECGVPRPALQKGGEPIGLGLSGERGGWKTAVEAGEFAILIAGYDSAEGGETADYHYNMGASWVPGKDGLELCPLLDGAPPQ